MSTAVHELTISRRFKDALRPLTAEERSLLESDIDANGCTDPIIVWANHDDTIIDGYNRYEICQSLGIPFKTKAMTFASEEEVLTFIKNRHRGRRNLTENELAVLRGHEYNAEKTAGHGVKSVHHSDVQNTKDRLAEKHDVGSATIERDATYASAVSTIEKNVGTKAKNSLLSGDLQKTPRKDVVKLAALPKDEQKEAIKGGKDAIRKAVTEPKAKPQYPYSDGWNAIFSEIVASLTGIRSEFGSFSELLNHKKFRPSDRSYACQMVKALAVSFKELNKEVVDYERETDSKDA